MPGFCDTTTGEISTTTNLPFLNPFETEGDPHTDALIASALQELTLQEREHVTLDMHGVANVTKETPDLLEKAFQELKHHLEEWLKREDPPSIPEDLLSPHAYRLAKSIDADFLETNFFRLMFLRAESFDADKAARRMLRYLNFKSKLFGSERLCREITIQDLKSEEAKILKKGNFQTLPVRDRSGRLVQILVSNDDRLDHESLVRVGFHSLLLEEFLLTQPFSFLCLSVLFFRLAFFFTCGALSMQKATKRELLWWSSKLFLLPSHCTNISSFGAFMRRCRFVLWPIISCYRIGSRL